MNYNEAKLQAMCYASGIVTHPVQIITLWQGTRRKALAHIPKVTDQQF